MGPLVPLTLLRLPAEIRNRIWQFTLPHHSDLEVNACECVQAKSLPCRFTALKRYNWKDEGLLMVNHQIRDEIDPFILRRKRVLKFCTDKCLERFLCETGDQQTVRGGRTKPLDDLKVHLVVILGPPPHSRMALAVAKMRVAGEIQKLIARTRPELLSVDLLPIEIIQGLCMAEEMHVWAHFTVKARREATRSWHDMHSPAMSSINRITVHREAEAHFARLRGRRGLRSTRSSSALVLNDYGTFDEGDVDEFSTQHRAALERNRRRRAPSRVSLNRESSLAVRIHSLGNASARGRRRGLLSSSYHHYDLLE